MAGGDMLERDLALDLLREVYASIKFAPSQDASTACGDSRRSVAETFAPSQDAFDETALEGEDCEIVAAEVETDPKPEPKSEPEPGPPIVPRPVAPEVIRSLYGTDTAEETAPPQESTAHPEPEPTETVEKPRATLGDAMAARRRTLGETLRNGERDMASKIAAAERPGLKRSIGLNDRFLMIRDMFDGDATAFDRAITRLDAFTDLDEAVIWIHDNFDWSADNKGAALLIGLLERKLER